MTLLKAVVLLILLGLWTLAGMVAAFVTMPLWGMSADQPLPWWVAPAALFWLISYSGAALLVIRSGRSLTARAGAAGENSAK